MGDLHIALEYKDLAAPGGWHVACTLRHEAAASRGL